MKIGKAVWSSVFLVCLLGYSVGAREARLQHSAYWLQRASHFRLLPNVKGEIIFLGDSITEGCNWSEMLQNPKVINRGISGDVSQGILDRLDEVTESFPAKIFLLIGINDLARGIPAEDILANVKRFIAKVRQKTPDTEIYLESLLPVNPDFKDFPDHTDKGPKIIRFNQLLERMAKDYKCRYVDLYEAFVDRDNKLDPEYSHDGLHLNGAGYAVWTQTISPYLQ
jgi:lysophospholipase L1-like esterase